MCAACFLAAYLSPIHLFAVQIEGERLIERKTSDRTVPAYIQEFGKPVKPGPQQDQDVLLLQLAYNLKKLDTSAAGSNPVSPEVSTAGALGLLVIFYTRSLSYFHLLNKRVKTY